MKLTRLQHKVLLSYRGFHTNGWSIPQVLRISWRQSLILLVWAVAGSWYMTQFSPWVGGLIAGLAAGALLRDIGHFQMAFRIWPVSREIINWQRVAELIESHEKGKAS